MPVPHFDYLAPTTIDEVVAALVKGGKDARVMAGGTDLMVKIRHRALFPKQLISLKRIDGLDTIAFDEKKRTDHRRHRAISRCGQRPDHS